MSGPTTILFVDDEPGIRLTLPAILTRFGFDVTTAATVPEALGLIATRPFDILISDLNIGHPSDGFTVVSAMRRTQPQARTFILTGYPAFETALEAIRQQVDDYLVKPADIESLVAKLRLKLNGEQAEKRIQPRPLADILEESRREIVARWLSAVRHDSQLAGSGLSDAELVDSLPGLLEEIISRSRGAPFSEQTWKAATVHGQIRFRQGFTVPLIVREARIMQETISRLVQENLLGLDVSLVIPEIVRIGETIQTFIEAAVREYTHARHAATELLSANKGKSVLLLSANPELSLLRRHALASAGFSVSRADSRRDAMQLLEQPFDVLVISYSLSSDDLVEMTQLFRDRNPNSPIVTVAKGPWQDLKVEFDAAVTGEEGPEALIEAVETV